MPFQLRFDALLLALAAVAILSVVYVRVPAAAFVLTPAAPLIVLSLDAAMRRIRRREPRPRIAWLRAIAVGLVLMMTCSSLAIYSFGLIPFAIVALLVAVAIVGLVLPPATPSNEPR